MTHASVDRHRALRWFLERLEQRLHDAALHLQELGARARDALDEHAHPGGAFAICRMMQIVPTLWSSSGPGSSDVARLEKGEDHPVAGERAIDGFDRHRPAHAER